ncbi:MAG: tRNA (N(6)-L-threonylcarbamoyladenosine(37)-C(2))-methylthiotransferase MtaB [Kordiimonadaceae bacterium]|jgi:threonylcarbamoyladenosine tRNA methylthiotransferase MtaB|nr:tRNA (N(6)-L-threonylcarbamoyladenosine(37)-C(2))-methylthiotransferase MtaB [Kordiimonadaceae bacterium]MBT6037573.1 tRNA (N(6)-L-threonylcarbamoyladenosine(37)-C(2))-methylthiotransferase MtaB [Kordiimonadaceae bacterium]MBT6329542.1 tRNA (N(6)-L-threonylcarbamoyladenosine(37)-C(2))-methylthiotransferase MtaB [Kordiimonadaceae bacterium]MBT7583411.1 tRNA (N(6)-L-threonylcarbamoyladenosine(37)-C(2))-methylthiotransferase MtaB [Kordiimonadaceae bacterium]
MSKVKVITFGCRLNTYESEVIKTHASNAGLDDTVIFNTCAVTAEATRQAKQSIRRAKRDNPDAKLIVTGCAAQIDAKQFSDMEEVDQILGNEEKLIEKSYQDFGISKTERVSVNDIMSVKKTAPHLIDGYEERSRAFVQVQNGCDHRCTFCIIPYGRGNSRSVPAGEVVNQIQKLVDNGYKEVIITGVDITSYGPDLPGNPTLGSLCQKILKNVPDLPRLRLSSIDSIEADQALFDVITNEERMMPHLHLSLQAGDNMILKRMKRRHNREDSIEFCNAVLKARPDVVFGADIIAGFPTETEEMFQNSMALVEDCNLTYLHVFPYSEREGTPAANMPQMDRSIRKERAARLRKLGEEKVDQLFLAQIGKTVSILVEKSHKDENAVIGHTEHFAPAKLKGEHSVGHIAKAVVTGYQDGILITEVLDV